MKWYRKAADAGNSYGMNNIGWLYQNGWGVGQDYAEAMKWYRKAADAGDSDAMYQIGVLYHKGWGVGQDYAEAMKWYRKAADAGCPFAKAKLDRAGCGSALLCGGLAFSGLVALCVVLLR